MTIHLPEDLERYVRLKVASGRFASEDEAISEAVRLLQRSEGTEPPAPGNPCDPREPLEVTEPAWKRVLTMMNDIPDAVFDRIPTDGSEELDHYLYGSPRRPTA